MCLTRCEAGNKPEEGGASATTDGSRPPSLFKPGNGLLTWTQEGQALVCHFCDLLLGKDYLYANKVRKFCEYSKLLLSLHPKLQ